MFGILLNGHRELKVPTFTSADKAVELALTLATIPSIGLPEAVGLLTGGTAVRVGVDDRAGEVTVSVIPLDVESIRRECRERWNSGTFLETGHVLPETDFPALSWERYEDYMRARIVRGTPGETGIIIVDFPAEGVEDNHLHCHPISDRVITVAKGSGEFIAVRSSGQHDPKIERFALVPGTRVWMPRGVLHTFLAGPDGLLVESVHNPWVPLEDPKVLVYPKNGERWQI